MIFFSEQWEPTIINEHITRENMQKWCDNHNIFINIYDVATFWAGFANFYGYNHGLSFIEASSFAYMISLFVGGMGVSCGTEAYFREEYIERDLVRKIEELKKEEVDEEKVVVEFFKETFRLYKEDIEKYSLKTHMLSFRLSQSDFDRFNQVDGDSKVDKLRVLMNSYFER